MRVIAFNIRIRKIIILKKKTRKIILNVKENLLFKNGFIESL